MFTLSAEEQARAHPSDQVPSEPGALRQRIEPALVRMAFGIIWSVDAWFKWQPEFQHTFLTLVQTGAANQPSWIEPWYHFWGMVLGAIAPVDALATALVETLIACCLLVGFARKPLYIAGALWSLSIWAIPEGFGTISRAAHTDIGTSIIYVLVFAALWALDACAGPRRDRLSLDALLERRFPHWTRIAEVGDAHQ